jgi:hypothetical protein
VLRLFSLLVFCPSLPQSLWALLLFLRCGITFAIGIIPLVTLSTCLWSDRSMLSSRLTLVLGSAIWCQLDSLRSAVCGTCPYCWTVRSHMEFQ